MRYELYHDESKVNGYWHGILLVPIDKKEQLLNLLHTVRKNTRYSHPLGIKKVKNNGPIFTCANSWVQIGVAALVSKQKGSRIPLFLGERVKGKPKYEQLHELIGVKFILFREKDNLSTMSNYLDYGGKVETTFRMGLKGGLHFLGNDSDPIHIEKMHFDGYEHHNRHIDKDRIVNRLEGLRQYCTITEHDDLIDDRSSNHTQEVSQEYDDCQLLQLTDLLVGCFRTSTEGATRDIHKKLAQPVNEIVRRYAKGYTRMQNSKWANSFSISQCYLESGQWKFESIELYKENTPSQQSLFG